MAAAPEHQGKHKDPSPASSSTLHFQHVLPSFLLRAPLSQISPDLPIYLLQQGTSDNFPCRWFVWPQRTGHSWEHHCSRGYTHRLQGGFTSEEVSQGTLLAGINILQSLSSDKWLPSLWELHMDTPGGYRCGVAASPSPSWGPQQGQGEAAPFPGSLVETPQIFLCLWLCLQPGRSVSAGHTAEGNSFLCTSHVSCWPPGMCHSCAVQYFYPPGCSSLEPLCHNATVKPELRLWHSGWQQRGWQQNHLVGERWVWREGRSASEDGLSLIPKPEHYELCISQL